MYHVVVLGRTRSGKTVFIRDGILPMLPRFIIFDVEQRDGFNAVVNTSTDNINEAIKAINAGLNVQYRSGGNSPKEISSEFNFLCKCVLMCGHYAIVSDEAADLSSPSFINSYHYAVLRKGLGRGVVHITATQRPQMISKHIFTQSQIKILFPLDDYDIQACRPYIPIIERVRELRPYEAIITDGEHTKKIKVEKRF